ncbi:MAG: hypothetical protein ACP5EK_06210, partial [Thermoplasmatota archaeon]
PLIDTLLQLYEGWADLHLTKPVVAVAMGGRYVDQQEKALLALDVPLVREPGRAVSALNKIVGYAEWQT